MSTAFIFPGQGSQTIGMGRDLAEHYPVAKEVFEEVDEALGFNLTDLMFSGDSAELMQTENAQPAIMAVSMAVVRVLEHETGKKTPDMVSCVAGHSLGEYSALCAAGALSIADTARLLRVRGLAMKEASMQNPGAMAAVLGLTMKEVSQLVSEVSKENSICRIANDNCPGQIVISGHTDAIERAVARAVELGARKAVKLPVSGAFHCPLMKPAEEKMREVLQNTPISQPLVPVVANITAEFVHDPQKVKELLVAQITGSVRWTESVQYMSSKGISDFVECGNGKVLSGLIKRINPDSRSISVGAAEGIAQGLAFFA